MPGQPAHPSSPQDSSGDAAALLEAAAEGDDAGSRLSLSAIGPIRAYSVALGALMGVYFLVLIYVLSDSDTLTVWVGTGIFLVILAVVVIGYLRARRATPPHVSRRLLIGILVTTALFVGGALLSTVLDVRSPLLWIPYAVVMLLPVTLSTFVRASR